MACLLQLGALAQVFFLQGSSFSWIWTSTSSAYPWISILILISCHAWIWILIFCPAWSWILISYHAWT